jgi:hypothetical protein
MRAARIFLALGIAVGMGGGVAAGGGCLSLTCTDDGTCASADATTDAPAKDQATPGDAPGDHAKHKDVAARGARREPRARREGRGARLTR